MTPTGGGVSAVGRCMTWLAGGVVAVALICGWCPTVAREAPAHDAAAAAGSVAAGHPAEPGKTVPLRASAIVEAESSVEDVDPSECSSRPCPGVRGMRAACPSSGVDERHRTVDPTVLAATAADLIRLCRLLL